MKFPGGFSPTKYSRVVSRVVVACDGIFARRLLERALVYVKLTAGPLPGRGALAGERVVAVQTRSAIQAGLRGTLVDVDGTHGTGETLGTVADGLVPVLGTGSTV